MHSKEWTLVHFHSPDQKGVRSGRPLPTSALSSCPPFWMDCLELKIPRSTHSLPLFPK